MKHLYLVKHPFWATLVGGKWSRPFNPGETLWWNDTDLSDPTSFNVDNTEWQTIRNEFLNSIELPE